MTYTAAFWPYQEGLELSTDDASYTIDLFDAREPSIATETGLSWANEWQNHHETNVNDQFSSSDLSHWDSIENIKMDVEHLSQIWKDIKATNRNLRAGLVMQILRLVEATCILRQLDGYTASEDHNFDLVLPTHTVEENLDLTDEFVRWKSPVTAGDVEEMNVPSSVCTELFFQDIDDWDTLWINEHSK